MDSVDNKSCPTRKSRKYFRARQSRQNCSTSYRSRDTENILSSRRYTHTIEEDSEENNALSLARLHVVLRGYVEALRLQNLQAEKEVLDQ